LSWPQPGRTVADFPADLGQLADHLGIDRFHVVGWSMGGPYAAACGVLLPNRVRSVTLFAPAPVGLSRPQGAEHTGKAFAWILARDDPWQMCQLYTTLGLEARRNPPLAVSLFTGAGDGLSPTEAALLAKPTVQQDFIEMIIEATHQGLAGLVEDMRVELAPWKFDPANVRVPMSLWQGDEDSFVGIESAHDWAAAVPGLEMKLLPGDGHMFPFERTEEFIASL
jgi:pimeloyl-ACP methyl ester carboxylesterase